MACLTELSTQSIFIISGGAGPASAQLSMTCNPSPPAQQLGPASATLQPDWPLRLICPMLIRIWVLEFSSSNFKNIIYSVMLQSSLKYFEFCLLGHWLPDLCRNRSFQKKSRQGKKFWSGLLPFVYFNITTFLSTDSILVLKFSTALSIGSSKITFGISYLGGAAYYFWILNYWVLNDLVQKPFKTN